MHGVGDHLSNRDVGGARVCRGVPHGPGLSLDHRRYVGTFEQERLSSCGVVGQRHFRQWAGEVVVVLGVRCGRCLPTTSRLEPVDGEASDGLEESEAWFAVVGVGDGESRSGDPGLELPSGGACCVSKRVCPRDGGRVMGRGSGRLMSSGQLTSGSGRDTVMLVWLVTYPRRSLRRSIGKLPACVQV